MVIYQKLFLSWPQNLFLNLQNIENFRIEKTFPKIMIFCFFSVWLLTVSKAIHEKNPKRALVLNRYEIINVSKEKLTQININLRKEKEMYPQLHGWRKQNWLTKEKWSTLKKMGCTCMNLRLDDSSQPGTFVSLNYWNTTLEVLHPTVTEAATRGVL